MVPANAMLGTAGSQHHYCYCCQRCPATGVLRAAAAAATALTSYVCAMSHQILVPVEGTASRCKGVFILAAINIVANQIWVTKVKTCMIRQPQA